MSIERMQPSDIDEEGERYERLWVHYCQIARSLDAGELMAAVCDRMRGESGDTPLAALIEEWLTWPQFDWAHPLVPPSRCEALGKYIAGVAAQVVEQAIERALARAD
jgi:hypothetical protein